MRLTSNPLIAMRMKAGYSSAEEASKALKISRVYLASIERGRSSPSPGLLARMVSLYRVSEGRLRAQIRKSQRDLLKRKLAAT